MRPPLRAFPRRRYNSTITPAAIYAQRLNILLATPTWSVKTLLPAPGAGAVAAPEITPSKLHHLLRLSALPPPGTQEQEEKLLQALEAHLHFVRAIQKVDTVGVKPLARIEEEVEELRRSVSFEEMVGEEEEVVEVGGGIRWEPTKLAKRKAGGFFVVDEKEMEV